MDYGTAPRQPLVSLIAEILGSLLPGINRS
jgi:hypothetical protein